MLIFKVISGDLHHDLILSLFRLSLLHLCPLFRLSLQNAFATTTTDSLLKFRDGGKQLHINLVSKLDPLLQNSDRLFCLLEAFVFTVHLL